jgi:hypothetical protein
MDAEMKRATEKEESTQILQNKEQALKKIVTTAIDNSILTAARKSTSGLFAPGTPSAKVSRIPFICLPSMGRYPQFRPRKHLPIGQVLDLKVRDCFQNLLHLYFKRPRLDDQSYANLVIILCLA